MRPFWERQSIEALRRNQHLSSSESSINSKLVVPARCNKPVTPVILKGDVYECTNLIKDLRSEYSIFCSGVIYPVVPKGVIMLRIIPTASHTLDDVNETISAFKEVKKKLDDGIYQKMGEKGAVLS